MPDDKLDANIKLKKNDLGRTNLPPLHNETLMEIFDFNESEIQTNRNRFMTQAQKQVLQDDLKNDADAMWLLMTIFLATAVVVGVIMSFQGLPMIYLVVGAGVLILPMMGFAYSRQTKTRQDLDKTRIKNIQGPADVLWVGRGTNMRARLRVGNKLFHISLYQGKALEEYDLAQLRVYYSEQSETLLSAEVVYPDIDKLKIQDIDADDDLLIEAGRQYDEQQT